MLSKCANPSCSTPLIYLREGKIFSVTPDAAAERKLEGPFLAKPATKVEHFWLCGPCSSLFTLVYSKSRGVSVVPKEQPKARRAAAS